MPDLSKRSDEVELMDDLECSGEIIDQTLRELEVINKWLGGNKVTLNGLGKLLVDQTDEISIADLGCGGGDMLKLIAQWGKKKGLKLKLIGVDANPHIIEFAKRNCLKFPNIEFEIVDIFSEQFKAQSYDIITSTLFTHHFNNQELVSFYSTWLKQARIGIVINDLHRHWLAYYSIKLLTALFSKSEMVKNDAAVSVMRSFKKLDLKNILREAGILNYSLKWMWAFRWQLVINKK